MGYHTVDGTPAGMMEDYPQMGPTRTSTMVAQNRPMTGINGETVKAATPQLQAVQDALVKDYSGIIKAIDKKNGKMGTK